MPNSIEFVLRGRRTLSEHLPSERIDVPLSLALRSQYLAKVLHERTRIVRDGAISLDDVDAAGFRIYIQWLKSHSTTFQAASSAPSGGGLLLRDAIDLIFAHMVGTKVDEPHFQDQVIDEMARVVDESQTPDLKVMEVLFLEKGASNVLKQFVVDRMFAVERRMLGMIRGFPNQSIGGRDGGEECEYHVHDHGKCYRDAPDYRHLCHATRVADTSHNMHGICDGITGSVHNKTRQTRPLSSSGLVSTSYKDNLSMFNMVNEGHCGSEEWSREIHGLIRRTCSPTTTKFTFQKPLPPIPSLRPGTSPSPPSSSPPSYSASLSSSLISSLHVPSPPSPHVESSEKHHVNHVISTKKLVLECLNRLPIDASPTSSNLTSSKEVKNTVQDLVLECLDRFNHQGPHESSPTSSDVSSNFSFERIHESIAPARFPPPAPPARSLPPPRSLPPVPPWCPAPSSPPTRKISCLRSPPPPSPQSQLHFLGVQEPILAATPPLVHVPQLQAHLTPLVKRKPAPLRGLDWLDQYNRINAMFPTDVEVKPAKRSRRSRFVEMMRSESRGEYY